MKLTLSTIAALMLTSAAALAFSLPAHEPDGYRGTSCDPTANVKITNAEGKYLYSNNPTCPEGNDGHEVAEEEEPEEPEDPEEPDEGEGDTGDGDTSGDGDK